MFTSIDKAISRMGRDQSEMREHLEPMRDKWDATGDIIEGIEGVWAELDKFIHATGFGGLPRYRFGDLIDNILLGTCEWLEEKSAGDSPWQNPESNAGPQVLKTDPEVQEKYSIVLGLINGMFTDIDRAISQMRPSDQSYANDALTLMRDGWYANDDIIKGIEVVWAELDFMLRSRDCRLGNLLEGIFRRIYRWLEQNGVEDDSWQNPMDLTKFTGILNELGKQCGYWVAEGVEGEILIDDFTHIKTVCEAIVEQESASGMQNHIAEILEVLRPVMERIDKSPPRWRFTMKRFLKDIVCRLEGHEQDAGPQVLKTDRESARKYSVVVELIHRMFTSIDEEISRMGRDQRRVNDALTPMRDVWYSSGDIIKGIEDLWAELDKLIHVTGVDGRPRYRLCRLIPHILRRTYDWLEQNSTRDNPWQDFDPSESSVCQEPLKCAICGDNIDAVSPMTLPCGHQFHDNCIGEWASRAQTCPCCRTGF
ncbi:hypothetical protein SeMB42_g07161 [Synchytrium endobioticum]|uniref:RING-type E3 ubiquitin transferase n=1 Tax=Synchytrium endobioticum TaxID=286115 RepID=A0A507C7W6_9FUNG|nr:hypothetical protein SeMB42_g07161 [Synchytrium endobioticum]